MLVVSSLQILGFRAPERANLPWILGAHCPRPCAHLLCGVFFKIDNLLESFPEKMTTSGPKNRGSHRRDRIWRDFLHWIFRYFLWILGGLSYQIAHKYWRKSKKSSGEPPVETAPRNCRFLSLVVVERVLTTSLGFRAWWISFFERASRFWGVSAKGFKDALAISYLVLQACISFCSISESGAFLFFPCSHKNIVAHMFSRHHGLGSSGAWSAVR